jgi:RNA polymerase sigma factor (sigma-70 family)
MTTQGASELAVKDKSNLDSAQKWAAQDAADDRDLAELARSRAHDTRDPARERIVIAQLLARWDAPIENYARLRAGADDGAEVAQDARRKIAEKLYARSSFDVPFHAVVNRCLRDAIAERRRWSKRHGSDPVGEEQLADRAGQSPDPAEHSADPRADRRILKAALRELGEPGAKIVWMKMIEERPSREIAAHVGLGEGAVDTRFSRAKPRLATLILERVRNDGATAEDET